MQQHIRRPCKPVATLSGRCPGGDFLHAWLSRYCAAGRAVAVHATKRLIIASRLQQAGCLPVFAWPIKSDLFAEGDVHFRAVHQAHNLPFEHNHSIFV